MKKGLLIGALIASSLCVGCASTATGARYGDIEEQWKSTRQYYAINSDTLLVEVTDPETGVHYLIFDGYKCGGITVMYDKDGNIKTDKED